MIEGHASTYFDDWVSFPFVPGHEVVGELDDGTRVVLEPVLGHAARGFEPPFDGAAPGDGDDYAHLAAGPLEPGIQTGFCCSTGGGWAPELRRPRQPAPPHRRRRARRAGRARSSRSPAASTPPSSPPRAPSVARRRRPVVAVLGAGTMGLAADRRARPLRARRHASSSAPATRTSSAAPARSAPTTWCRLPSSPAPCAASSAATLVGDHLSSRRPRHHRRRRLRGLARRGPSHHPPPRPRS